MRSTDIMVRVPRLLAATEAGKQQVRLLGLTVSNLSSLTEIDKPGMQQLLLPFDEPLQLRK